MTKLVACKFLNEGRFSSGLRFSIYSSYAIDAEEENIPVGLMVYGIQFATTPNHSTATALTIDSIGHKYSGELNNFLSYTHIVSVPDGTSEKMCHKIRKSIADKGYDHCFFAPESQVCKTLISTGTDVSLVKSQIMGFDQAYKLQIPTEVNGRIINKTFAIVENGKIKCPKTDNTSEKLEKKVLANIRNLNIEKRINKISKKPKITPRKLAEVTTSDLKFRYMTEEQGKVFSSQEVFLPFPILDTKKAINDMDMILSMYKKQPGKTSMSGDELKESVLARLEKFMEANEDFYKQIVDECIPPNIKMSYIGKSSRSHFYGNNPGREYTSSTPEKILKEVSQKDALRQSMVSLLDHTKVKFVDAKRKSNVEEREQLQQQLLEMGLTYYIMSRYDSNGRINKKRVNNYSSVFTTVPEKVHKCNGFVKDNDKFNSYIGMYFTYPYFLFDQIPEEYEMLQTTSKTVEQAEGEKTIQEFLSDANIASL